MENVKITQKGDKMTIEIDTSKRLGPSASGKTIGIASTKGNKAVEGGIFIGLNVYVYPAKHPE